MSELNKKILKLDKRIKQGYYSDVYFNRTKYILERDNHHPILKMQIFQKNNDVCLCGVEESIEILKESLGERFREISVESLSDGEIVNAWETAMTISGDYSLFAHLETVYLGALARGTKVATNVYRCVKEAKGKPILFFPARFDSHLIQSKDGYSYNIGRGVTKLGGVSTDAQGEWWGSKGLGTIPHGLIAAYNGDTVKAALKFAEYTDPEIKRIVLVDFENDCVKTTIEVANAMFEKYKETKDKKYKLFGVRLDTSGTMVDESIKSDMGRDYYLGDFKPTGVNKQLVLNVKNALMNRALLSDSLLEEEFYKNIGIIVSGGFTPKKIKEFEELKLPVVAYGVGSSLLKGDFDFTADIVQKRIMGRWIRNSKKGRRFNNNHKLKIKC